MDSHSNKLEALEIFNMNEKNVIAWFLFLNPLPISQLFKNFRIMVTTSRDPFTRYLYFKMIRTMNSFWVPNFDWAP